MTPSHQELVRASFAKVAVMPEVAGALFYERLFDANPEFRALFKGDMRVQGMKLMTMLSIVVYHLHEPNETLDAVRDLGQRHVGYGVMDSYYATLGACLLSMLQELLGEDFTPAVREAWRICYDEMASQMIAAGHAVAAESR